MNKLVVAITVSAPLLIITGCAANTGVNTVIYDPAYSNDYVYSVGYYNTRPYWGNNYYYIGYPGYYWGNTGYWGAGYFGGY
ncbi:hypothetical protein TUM19329_03400 [Legionella antarctica]|uniref:Glycine-rich protein n=1 Tax=Legionella antarctica TaxID=2708020 RepID=A0A6F8T0L2_9GAMM|nr:hypothetical protein [Legionella antarctica]BCA93979.1 hypothetical protein TUM19329_03400 [Legionella antarctica]